MPIWETIERRIEKIERQIKVGDKSTSGDLALCRHIHDALAKGMPVRQIISADEHADLFKELNLLTAKKVLYVANTGETTLKAPAGCLKDVEEFAAREGSACIAACGNLEAEIAELHEEDRKVFLADLGLQESGLEKLIKAGYALLDLITFYTTAGTELRAWTIREGTKAPAAAGRIHSDMERGFIRAEVIHFHDFIDSGNLATARDKGLIRSEGRDYTVRDGDIILFRFNV